METIASTTEALERTVPVAPGGTFFADLDRGSIEVASHDLAEVHIWARATGIACDLASFVLERSGRDLYLDMTLGGWLQAMLAPVKVKVRVLVPRHYSVDLETRGGRIEARDIGGRCAASTRGGRIDVVGVEGHALLRTSGGRISVEDVTGDVLARTSGGKIQVSEIDGDCDLKTSGGGIRVTDVLGSVEAKTSGGSITADFADMPGGDLATSGGSIEVNYPEGCGLNLDARTSGGRVDIAPEIAVDGSCKKRECRARLDGGGHSLRLATSGGSIRVGTWLPPEEFVRGVSS